MGYVDIADSQQKPSGAQGGSKIGGGDKAASAVARWLCLAAAPTFAIMALLTGVFGGDQPDSLCMSGHGSPFDGMIPMYLLMSAFHLAPWLKLISGRRMIRFSARHSPQIGSR